MLLWCLPFWTESNKVWVTWCSGGYPCPWEEHWNKVDLKVLLNILLSVLVVQHITCWFCSISWERTHLLLTAWLNTQCHWAGWLFQGPKADLRWPKASTSCNSLWCLTLSCLLCRGSWASWGFVVTKWLLFSNSAVIDIWRKKIMYVLKNLSWILQHSCWWSAVCHRIRPDVLHCYNVAVFWCCILKRASYVFWEGKERFQVAGRLQKCSVTVVPLSFAFVAWVL